MLHEDIEDWAFVVSNGKDLVGKLALGWLSPVYEIEWLHEIVPTSPTTPPVVRRASVVRVQPALGFGSLTRMRVPDGAIVVPFGDLSLEEQNALMSHVTGFEAMLRKQRSGLVTDPQQLNAQAQKLKLGNNR